MVARPGHCSGAFVAVATTGTFFCRRCHNGDIDSGVGRRVGAGGEGQGTGMAEYELVIRAERAVTPEGVHPATVAIRDGQIAAIAGPGESPDAAETVELPGSEVLLPGLVDTHVHVNEPGRTEWEGFATATRAAAAGGVTTLIDMPLNSLPPTTTTAALADKRAAARPSAHVDVGFWGGAVPGNAGRPGRAAPGRGVRLQGVPRRLRGARVRPAGQGRPGRGPRRDRAAWRAAHRARRGSRRPRGGPGRGGPGVYRLPGVASGGGRGHRDRGPAVPPPGGTAPGCTSCIWRRPARCR